jgi:hypothetical protein
VKHVAYGGANVDAHAMGRACEAVEHRVVVRAVNLVVRGAVIACHVRDGVFVTEALACIVPSKDAGADTSAAKKPHRLGRDIDTRSHFTQFAGRLEHRDARARVGRGKGRRCLRRRL